MEQFSKELDNLGGAAVRGEAVAVDINSMALAVATKIMGYFVEPIPGVQLKAKIQIAVREAMKDYRRGAPVSARAADAPSEPSKVAMLRQALIDLHHAIQFAHDSLGGGIHKMPTMMHHDGTVTEFIETVLEKSRAADALDSQPAEPKSCDVLDDGVENNELRDIVQDIISETQGHHKGPWAYKVASWKRLVKLIDGRSSASSQPTDGGVKS